MLTNKEFGELMEKRTKQFALRIVRLCCQLPNTPEANIVRHQLIRSGTSIGANYREANRSVSPADFKHKISLCEKESSETQYWLEIIMEAPMLPAERVQPDHAECSELLAIFTSARRGTKGK